MKLNFVCHLSYFVCSSKRSFIAENYLFMATNIPFLAVALNNYILKIHCKWNCMIDRNNCYCVVQYSKNKYIFRIFFENETYLRIQISVLLWKTFNDRFSA